MATISGYSLQKVWHRVVPRVKNVKDLGWKIAKVVVIGWPGYNLKLLWILWELLRICNLPLEIGCSPCSKNIKTWTCLNVETHKIHWHIFGSKFFCIFAKSNIDLGVSILHKICSMQNNLIHIKILNMVACFLVASSKYYHCHWSYCNLTSAIKILECSPLCAKQEIIRSIQGAPTSPNVEFGQLETA